MTIFLTLSTLPSYAAPSTDSLVGYWKFDETSGTSAADASGDGNTGTLTNGPTISTDVPSTISFTNARSLSFDGTDDYVTLGDVINQSLPITISLWAKFNSSATTVFFNTDKGVINTAHNHSGVWLGKNSSNQISLGYGSNTACSSTGRRSKVGTTALSTGTWYHISAIIRGATDMNIYINGVDDGGTYSGTGGALVNTTRAAAIGLESDCSGSTTYYANGLIDDVRIYNRALSATEISALAAGNHILATWDGDTSTNFETAANWDIGAIPDPYNRVTIPNAGARPVCTANIQTTGLTINSGASLDLSSFNLTQNDSGTFVNNGTLLLNGTQTLSNFTNDTDTGTEIIRGSTNLTGFPTGATYNNLRIEDPTENGLVGYWKLDEGGGTSAADLSGNSNTGTLTSGPTYSTDVNTTTTFPNARSLSFDGVNDFVSVADASSLNFNSGSFTTSAWIKPNAISTNSGIITRWECFTNTNTEFQFITNSSKISLTTIIDASNSNATVGNTTLVNGNWYHVAATYVDSSKAVVIYLNGTQDGSGTHTTSRNIVNGTLPIFIGARGCGSNDLFFNGLIDDVRIYNRALSAAEITNLAAGRYAAGDTGTATHTFNNNVTVNGTLSLDSGIINSSSYTDTVTGLASIYGGAYTAGSAAQTFNGGLTIAGGTYTGGTGTSDVNGALTISAGTLTAPGSTSSLNVSGNFAHSSGTFTHNSGTVLLDGNDQTISGTTTFNNLTKTTSNTTLTFPASTTQTIAGTLTLQGASGLPIRLRSSTDGTQWSIDPQGTRTVEYLDIKDSNNTNSSPIVLEVDTYTNSGNNINWTFTTRPSNQKEPPNSPIIEGSIDGKHYGSLSRFDLKKGQRLVVNIKGFDQTHTNTVSLSFKGPNNVGTFTNIGSGNPATAKFTFTPTDIHENNIYLFEVTARNNHGLPNVSNVVVTVAKSKEEVSPTPTLIPSVTPRPSLSAMPPKGDPSASPQGKPPIIIVQPPTPKPSSKPSSKPSIVPSPTSEKVEEIEAEFPKIPDYITLIPTPSQPKDEIPSDEKPEDKELGNSNVVLAGSETSFILANNSEAANLIKSKPSENLQTFIKIIDSAGKEFEVTADYIISSTIGKPIIVHTGIIPENAKEGPATLVLIIHNELKATEAKIKILIRYSQARTEDEIVAGLLKPQVSSIKIIREKEKIRLIILGNNFFSKEIVINGKTISTTHRQTEVSLLPSTLLKREKMKVLESRRVIIATYKILDKKIKGKVTVNVVNPYGQIIKNIEIPDKNRESEFRK